MFDFLFGKILLFQPVDFISNRLTAGVSTPEAGTGGGVLPGPDVRAHNVQELRVSLEGLPRFLQCNGIHTNPGGLENLMPVCSSPGENPEVQLHPPVPQRDPYSALRVGAQEPPGGGFPPDHYTSRY